MYYERIREKEEVKEKESDSEIEELSMNQSSEDPQQLTNNIEQMQNTRTAYDNYPKKEKDNYVVKNNAKDFLTSYISKSNLDYKTNNGNKENNYLAGNKNIVKYEQKNMIYNQNIVRKNETEVNNFQTEENDKKLIYQQYNTLSKYDTKNSNMKEKLNNKETNTRKLNFSYDENVNNFDNYNKIKSVKVKKDLIKMEYNNMNLDKKFVNESDYNSKNLKIGYKVNNNKDEFAKTYNNYYSQNQINYDDKKYDKKENFKRSTNNFQKKNEAKNIINSQNIFKNENDSKVLRKQIINNNYRNNIKILEDKNTDSKPNYYFSYDYSTKIKNYDTKNLTNSEFSTALDTAKYKNCPEEKNVEVKEFNVSENENKTEQNNNIHASNNIIYNKYELNQKEKNYINNLKTLNTEIKKENTKTNSIIKKYLDNNAINNNNNEKKEFDQKLKYYNSMNNLIINDINDINDRDNLSSLLKKEYSKIKIVSAPAENEENNKTDSYEKDYQANTPEKEAQIINKTPQKKEIEISYPNLKKAQMIPESYNINTLESAVIRNMDEEEEIRTLELEKERQKLDELEKEKQKLILEEKERRDRIMMEIQRQEMQEIERKKLMRQKYEEKLRKRKEDEEKLMKIKEEQQRQLREITELKNNRKYDEQKLLLLTEGKLNKKQRSDYMIGIGNKTTNINMNKLPFKIDDVLEKSNNVLIKKMKNTNIGKNSKFWNYKNNIVENKENSSLNNSIDNDEYYEENIIKDNNDFEEIENNSEEHEENEYKSINELEIFSENNQNYQLDKNIEHIAEPDFNNKKENKTIYMNKNKRININNNPLVKSNNDEYKTFSPKITHKKNINLLSPLNEFDYSSNKISTELPDFSSNKMLKDKNIEQNKESEFQTDNKATDEKKEMNDSINKDYYQKKKFIFNKRQIIKEDQNNSKFTDSKKGSFARLNELREITSKLANEVEKKIQLINQNKLLSKSKSIPKLPETNQKYDYMKFDNNLDSDNKINDESNIVKDKNKDTRILLEKSYKYKELIKDTKIEINNLINSNQNQFSRKKSLSGDNILPEEIKKECISELKKVETFTKKKGKENMQFNTGKVNKLLDNINRNKKSGLLRNYKTVNNINQKAFYNEYLYGNKKKIQGQEIDQKFLPYYKEIYGETTPDKDI